jgi:hypothetical protein
LLACHVGNSLCSNIDESCLYISQSDEVPTGQSFTVHTSEGVSYTLVTSGQEPVLRTQPHRVNAVPNEPGSDYLFNNPPVDKSDISDSVRVVELAWDATSPQGRRSLASSKTGVWVGSASLGASRGRGLSLVGPLAGPSTLDLGLSVASGILAVQFYPNPPSLRISAFRLSSPYGWALILGAFPPLSESQGISSLLPLPPSSVQLSLGDAPLYFPMSAARPAGRPPFLYLFLLLPLYRYPSVGRLAYITLPTVWAWQAEVLSPSKFGLLLRGS